MKITRSSTKLINTKILQYQFYFSSQHFPRCQNVYFPSSMAMICFQLSVRCRKIIMNCGFSARFIFTCLYHFLFILFSVCLLVSSVIHMKDWRYVSINCVTRILKFLKQRSIHACRHVCNVTTVCPSSGLHTGLGLFHKMKMLIWSNPNIEIIWKNLLMLVFFIFFSLVNTYCARMCEDLFMDQNVIVSLALKWSSHLKDRVPDLIRLKHPVILRCSYSVYLGRLHIKD